MSIRFSILLLSMFFANLATARDWQLVVESQNWQYFVDWSTLKNNGNLRRLWTLSNPRIQREVSTLQLLEVDCYEEKARDLQMTFFTGAMATGDTIPTLIKTPSDWAHPPLRSARLVLLQEICTKTSDSR